MSATSSAAGSDFGADDEVTSAAVGLILDSLDDIHCLMEAKNKVKSNQMTTYNRKNQENEVLNST